MSCADEPTPPAERGHCVRCGIDTDIHIGTSWVCIDCYPVIGSCCNEYGQDDDETP
ncbi:MAG: hypothetical protein ACYTF0_01720 [Planctomycetota bacterium]|jgi:hypothetical protein